MLMGIGAAEFVIAVPVLVAAILANCTPTTIAMASWVVFHSIIGMLAGTSWYFSGGYLPGTSKLLFRKIYTGLIVIGIALALAASIHGGVGSLVGYHGTDPNHRVWWYSYNFDIFFGVFVGIFEILCLMAGIWFLYADERKIAKAKLYANQSHASFGNLQLALKKKAESNANLKALDKTSRNPSGINIHIAPSPSSSDLPSGSGSHTSEVSKDHNGKTEKKPNLLNVPHPEQKGKVAVNGKKGRE